MTQEEVNIAEKAHIWSFSDAGPRGNKGLAKDQLNDLSNLILLCDECHKKIDKDKTGERYSAELMREWKQAHERRIELATGIAPEKASNVVLYGAFIGQQQSPLSFSEAATAMFPARYPACDRAIELGMRNSSFRDAEDSFWQIESENLTRLFEERVRLASIDGDCKHLSVFALAPQPLLVLLGGLLSDVQAVDVYQLHREPRTWKWLGSPSDLEFVIEEPPAVGGCPALVLSVSATITPDRVTVVLGPDTCLWHVTVHCPHNDIVRTQADVGAFRQILRQLLDRIKAQHGQGTLLHIFPALPCSLAVELGRIRQPKADLPWRLYDQSNELGGFAHTIDIPYGGTT